MADGKDIFGRQISTPGIYKADQAVLNLQGTGLADMLITQLQIQYGYSANRIFALNSNGSAGNGLASYFVCSQTQGQGSFSQVIGPKKVGAAVYTQLGDPCKAESNKLTLNFTGSTCENGATTTASAQQREISGVFATNLSSGIDANSLMCNESVSFMFTKLTQSS